MYSLSTPPRTELPLGSMPPATAIQSVGIIEKGDTSNAATNVPTATTPGIAWSKAALLATGSAPSNACVTSAQPLILASSYPPVPARLVDKIRAGGYVEMKELMPDNIALLQALEALHPAAHLTNPTRPKMREVSDILT